MKLFDAAALRQALPYFNLVDAIDAAFQGGFTVPVRALHNIDVTDGQDSTLLLMPHGLMTGF